MLKRPDMLGRLAAAMVVAAAAPISVTAAPAYIIGALTVSDPEAYARDYAAHVTPLVAAYGGHYLVRGGAVSRLEGEPPSRVVVLEFPDAEAARALWNSPAYRALAPVRRRLATGTLYLVEGLLPKP